MSETTATATSSDPTIPEVATPTEPGWYWHIDRGTGAELTIKRVSRGADGELVHPPTNWCSCEMPLSDGRWWGPIPKPDFPDPGRRFRVPSNGGEMLSGVAYEDGLCLLRCGPGDQPQTQLLTYLSKLKLDSIEWIDSPPDCWGEPR